MGELADRLSLLTVDARSPDGYVEATVGGRRDVRIKFAWDAYRKYRAAELAHQLESLAAVAWSRYRRRYLEILASWADEDEPIPPTDEEREFQRRRDALEVGGVSARGWVSVRSRALVSWQVRITDEPVGELTEQEFLAELESAVAAVLADYDARVIMLTDEISDIGLPRALRVTGQGRT